MPPAKKLIIVLGPTAVGKTDFGIELAEEFSSPIINCDSRQIYREMRIGTARPDEAQLSRVKHYLIATRSITERYTAGLFEIEALALAEELFKTRETLVMVGGSGLYIDAFCNGLDDFPDADPQLRESLMQRLEEEGIESLRFELSRLDPETAQRIDPANRQRIVRALEVCIATGRPYSSLRSSQKKQRPFEIVKIGLTRPRSELYGRIDRRVDAMMDSGLEKEALELLPHRNLPALNTVGYKELFGYFDGLYNLTEAVRLIKRNTRHYAKKQITWWQRDSGIQWVTSRKECRNL